MKHLLSADAAVNFIKKTIKSNNRNTLEGKRKLPVCIWGQHGIGKTSIVEQAAKELEIGFIDVPSAQFEEMGDLLGLPESGYPMEKDGKTKYFTKEQIPGMQNVGWKLTNGDVTTMFCQPDWVPIVERDGEKGILLIDDFNRADARIINGIMQLLQNAELVSWALPTGWHIMLTANPDDEGYSTTPLDEAQLDRFASIDMRFDKASWYNWANSYNLLEEGADFIMMNPQVITGHTNEKGQNTNRKCITPRSIVQFFDAVKWDVKDYLDPQLTKAEKKEAHSYIYNMGMSTIGEEVRTFINFLTTDQASLLKAEDILETSNWNNVEKKLKVMMSKQRVDQLHIITLRVERYLINDIDKLSTRHKKNLLNFMSKDVIPSDMCSMLWKNLSVLDSRKDADTIRAKDEIMTYMSHTDIVSLLHKL